MTSPAMASSTSENAACAMTSDFWGRAERSRVERLAPRRASAGSECEEIHAGATPKMIPVISESTKAKARIGNDGDVSMGTKSEPRKAISRMARVPK